MQTANGHAPFALVLIGQLFVFAVEAVVLGGDLLRVCGHTIHFAVTVIDDGGGCATQRHFAHRPVRIVVEIDGQHGDLQFVIVIEVNDAVRAVDIVEWREAFHCRLVELVRSQLALRG